MEVIPVKHSINKLSTLFNNSYLCKNLKPITMNLTKVLETAIANNGISYSISTGNYNVTTGYMVSIQGQEWKVSTINDDILKFYVKHHLNELWDKDRFLGIWLNKGQWYLDVSVNVEDLDEALRLGKNNNQIAIWDCAKAEEIRLTDEA